MVEMVIKIKNKAVKLLNDMVVGGAVVNVVVNNLAIIDW